MLAQLAANIGGVPDERLLAPQILTRAISRPRHYWPLILRRRNPHLAAQFVKRNHRPIRRISRDPVIFSGARQPRHHDHFADRVIKGKIIRIAVFFAKVEEAAVIARELARSVQAALFDAVLREERDVVEQFLLIVANSASRVGLCDQRQQITARGLAGGKQLSPRVSAVDQEKRDLMVTNQVGRLLTSLKRRAHPPKQLSRHNLTTF